jgi:hypothetical protein
MDMKSRAALVRELRFEMKQAVDKEAVTRRYQHDLAEARRVAGWRTMGPTRLGRRNPRMSARQADLLRHSLVDHLHAVDKRNNRRGGTPVGAYAPLRRRDVGGP